MPPKQDENPILLSPRSEEHMHHHGGHNSPCCSRVFTGSNGPAKELVTPVDENHNEGKNWGGYCFGDVAAHFEASCKRAHKLACLLQETQVPQNSSCSPTILFACKSSVENKLPTVLQQTSQLVENWKNSRDNNASDHMVAKIRATLGLQSMDQFLDKIELTMSLLPEKEALEKQLASIMVLLRKQGESQGKSLPDFSSCSVSPLHGASSLFFDVAVGPAVQASCDNETSLRLQAEVQPIMELPAQDLIQGRIAPESVQACIVELESCKHRLEPYHQSSGWIGEAILRVRLSLIDGNHQVPKLVLEEEKDALSNAKIEESAVRIKEVRVTQLNAYPPRPRTNVDIYTSSIFGESDISVTLISKTYQTKDGEPPRLSIELVMPIGMLSTTSY